MIFETIELITDKLMNVETLQSRINNAEFDDILNSHSFLIMTNKGLCLVQKDENGVQIKYNTTVDLSQYIDIDKLNVILTEKNFITNDILTQELAKIKIPDVSNFVTNDKLDEYAKTADLPSLTFESDGTLVVTIGNNTYKYSPVDTTI